MSESDNTVFVQLAADVGLEDVVNTAEDLGITTPGRALPVDSHRRPGVRRQPA